MKYLLLRGVFLLGVLGTGSALAASAPSPSSPPAPSSASYAPHRVIVKLRPALARTDADAVRSSLSARVRAQLPGIDAEVWDVGALPVADAMQRLKNDPRVEFAEPDYIVHATAVFPSDPQFSQEWYMHNAGQSGGKVDADIDAPEAWTTTPGAPVLIGVIDTGIDMGHQDLKNSIYTNPNEIPGNNIDDDGNGYVDDVHGWDFLHGNNHPQDDNGHGTHVSGIIAAPGNDGVGMAGVCWSARVIPLKFLDLYGNGATSDAILALQYAVRMGVRVVNMSWGGAFYSQALRAALIDARDHGVLCVAASGNDGIDASVYPSYPAGYELDNMVSVASTDRADALSLFSDYGASVDLAAPGSDIVSAYPGDRYIRHSGTSMACAVVSGAACLLWSRAPYMTDTDVKAALMASVDRLPALDGRVKSGGRINLQRLVSTVDAVAPAPVTTLAVEATASNAIDLAWTASGDDGSSGTASAYELRYATTPVNASNFASSNLAGTLPHPLLPGSAQSFEVPGLSFGTKYYFGLVVIDEAGNRSTISNVVTATTLGVPVADVVPDEFNATLLTGATATRNLTIHNGGAGTLDFSVSVSPGWVRLDPASARIAAGESRSVNVVFDAAHVPGGTYNSTVLIASNDPGRAGISLVVALQVSDAPNITVETTTLECGDGVIGVCAQHDLMVTNTGTDVLTVGSIDAGELQFVVPAVPFLVNPGESHAVPVFFCPQVTGKVAGALSIHSNDPDRPEVAVVLHGRGVAPPIVSTQPAAIAVDLYTGGTATRTISLSNTGGSDLKYTVSIPTAGPALEVTGAASAASDVIATAHPVAHDALAKLRGKAVPQRIAIRDGEIVDSDTKPISSPVRAPAAVPVLAEPNNVAEVFGSTANGYFGSEIMRGNIFHCTTATNLKEYRFYLNPIAPSELWFVVYENDTQTGLYSLVAASNLSPSPTGEGWYSSGDINVPLQRTHYYMMAATFDGETGYFNQSNITPYPIPASFGALIAGAGWNYAPYAVFPPYGLQFVPSTAYGAPVAYYQTTITESVVRWLSVSPEEGTVHRSGTTAVHVDLSTRTLAPGDHDAVIRVASNDPSTPNVDMPVHVHVNAAPDIAFPSGPVDFGECFTGANVADTLLVRNAGALALILGHLACNNTAFTVTPASMALAPGDLAQVIVAFRPKSEGVQSATLSITSNDPDEPVATMLLRGTGRKPPHISVPTAAVSAAARPGEKSIRTLSIVNSGESALSFQLTTQNPEPSAHRRNKILPHERNLAAASLGGNAPAVARTGASYSGHRETTGALTRAIPQIPQKEQAANGQGLKVLILYTGDISEIVEAIAYDPDIATLEFFNAEFYIPTLADLAPYDVVLETNDFLFKDATAVGNALADYVDSGGSVIVTLAAFIENYQVGGRFASGGYLPFEIGTGPGNQSILGEFDVQHPIMNGVLFIYGELLGNTSIVPAAKLVASWDDGRPFVATTKHGQVIGMNLFIGDGGYWGGDVPALISNALKWTTGVRWLQPLPASGVVAPHQYVNVTLGFDGDLPEGKYAAVLRVSHNDPVAPVAEIPVSFAVDSTSAVTGVGDTPLPARYALESNHPNPFNPTTTIAYDLAGAGRSRLVVYDVNGARIRELVNVTQHAGHYTVSWDGRDDRGAAVASGVYFYRLEGSRDTAAKKMVLLK